MDTSKRANVRGPNTYRRWPSLTAPSRSHKEAKNNAANAAACEDFMLAMVFILAQHR